MFPPLPPFPSYAPPRHYPHYPHAASHMPASQGWYPHGMYGNNTHTHNNNFATRFVAVPSRRQPFVPRNAMSKAPVAVYAKPRVLARSTVDKENLSPDTTGNNQENHENETVADVNKVAQALLVANDNKATQDSSVAGSNKMAQVSLVRAHVDDKIWSSSSATALVELPAEKSKSIWSVSPLELSSMMLRALCEKRRLRPQPRPLRGHRERSNQETHELSDGDDSSGDSSGTDTDDEDLPVLTRYTAYRRLDEFPCDLDHTVTSERLVNGSDDVSQNQPATKISVVLDYRKLFDTTQAASPQYPTPTYTLDTTPEVDEFQKRPAHMAWWPGDWKCAKCGNHNFSYRGICKRCHEGRYEEAGYIYPIPPC